MNGEGTFLWNNCQKAYSGRFKDNKMDGLGKMMHRNGQIVKGKWESNHNLHIADE